MLKHIAALTVASLFAASPALAEPTMITTLPEKPIQPAQSVLPLGAPAAQLGVGDGAIGTETLIHIGGLVFVVGAAVAVIGSSGGDGDPIPSTANTN